MTSAIYFLNLTPNETFPNRTKNVEMRFVFKRYSTMAIQNDDVHIGTLRSTAAASVSDFDGSTENHRMSYEMTKCTLNDVKLLNFRFVKTCALLDTRTNGPLKNH